ncbi:hypothetical protein FACS1894192_02520 [Bacilli bacterium]|nr:hypothetical protein FACS1894192_02520 [Bacilli bacterium]
MVNRDKSADERFEYNTKIRHHENQMDEFSQIFRRYLDNLERTRENLRRNFEAEQSLREQSRDNLSRNDSALEETQYKFRDRMRVFDEQLETGEGFRRKTVQKLDDEREQLIRERNALPWE